MSFHNTSIFYKYQIVKAADEMGVDLFLDRTGSKLVPSKRALNKWRQDIELVVLPMPKLKTINSRCELESEIAAQKISLAKKNLLMYSRSAQDLGNFIRPIYKRKITGGELTKAEIKSLVLHGLTHPDGELTDLGNAYKLLTITSKSQCALLNIPLTALKVDVREGRVEHSVMNHLNQSTDVKWFYLENYFYDFFVHNLTRPIFDMLGLASYHRTIDVISRDFEVKALELFTPDYFESMLEQFERSEISLADLCDNGFSSMDTDEILRVYRAIGYERFRSIISHDLTEPYVYSRGWPDLLGLDGEKVRFVEVKHQDSMTVSQIETFPRILSMSLGVEVYKVQYGRTLRSIPVPDLSEV